MTQRGRLLKKKSGSKAAVLRFIHEAHFAIRQLPQISKLSCNDYHATDRNGAISLLQKRDSTSQRRQSYKGQEDKQTQ